MTRTYWDEPSSLGICIDWFGPYKTYEKFMTDIRKEDEGTKIIYYAECREGWAQYIGLSTNSKIRFNNQKTMKNLGITGGTVYWYGILNSQGKSGRRTKPGNKRPSAPLDLDQAETALINWLSPEKNDRKTDCRPKQSVSITNRFFSTKKAKPKVGPENLPQILFYDWILDRYTCHYR